MRRTSFWFNAGLIHARYAWLVASRKAAFRQSVARRKEGFCMEEPDIFCRAGVEGEVASIVGLDTEAPVSHALGRLN